MKKTTSEDTNKKLSEQHQTNPFLTGNYAPVLDELDVHHLKIEGEVPRDLNGTYMRNGPNPAFPPMSYTYNVILR